MAVERNLSKPFLNRKGGNHFEARVQALFVLMMLTKGFAPGLPCWPILKIKLQGRYEGFKTDDGVAKNIAPLQHKGLLKYNPLSGKMVDKMLKVKW